MLSYLWLSLKIKALMFGKQTNDLCGDVVLKTKTVCSWKTSTSSSDYRCNPRGRGLVRCGGESDI